MEYDRVPYVQDYLAEHGQYWPLYVLAIYAGVIVGGQRLMKVRHVYGYVEAVGSPPTPRYI